MRLRIVFLELNYCDVTSTFVQDTIALAMPTMIAWMDKEVRSSSSVDQVLSVQRKQTLPNYCF